MTASLLGFVSIALSLTGFGVSSNPKAPSGAEVMAYAPDRADFMAYVDVEAVLPRNYQALKDLANGKELSKVPELQRELRSAVGQIEMGLGMVRGAVQVDPISDIKSIAAWVTYPKKGKPELIVHVRGTFPKDFVTALARTKGGTKPTTIGGRAAIIDDGMMLTTAADGSILFGSVKLVQARAKKGPRLRNPRPGSAGGQALRLLDRKPLFALFSSPSAVASKRLTSEMGSGDNALSDLLSGHRFAAFTMHDKGISWLYQAKSASGVETAKMASIGLLQLMRATHFGSRGLANIFFAAVDSYRATSKELDAIIRAKSDLMQLVDEFVGDGKFQERVDVDARSRTVTVSATGRSLSDVFPVAGMAPLAAAGTAFWFMSRGGLP